MLEGLVGLNAKGKSSQSVLLEEECFSRRVTTAESKSIGEKH